MTTPTVSTRRRLFAWICILAIIPLIALFALYVLTPLSAVFSIFPLLCGLFFLFPRRKWILIVTWILFAVAYFLCQQYFYFGLMTIWAGLTSVAALGSLLLNIALVFPIVMSVATYREWKKKQDEE